MSSIPVPKTRSKHLEQGSRMIPATLRAGDHHDDYYRPKLGSSMRGATKQQRTQEGTGSRTPPSAPWKVFGATSEPGMAILYECLASVLCCSELLLPFLLRVPACKARQLLPGDHLE